MMKEPFMNKCSIYRGATVFLTVLVATSFSHSADSSRSYTALPVVEEAPQLPAQTHDLTLVSKELCRLPKCINAVTFSSDGTKILAERENTTTPVWDVTTGEVSILLKSHSSYIVSLACSPSNPVIATGSTKGELCLWNTKGHLLTTLKNHTSSINTVVFSPQGDLALTGSLDNTVCLWDMQHHKLIKVITQLKKWVSFVEFSPDAQYILIGCIDGTVKLYSITPVKVLPIKFVLKFKHSKRGVSAGAFNSDSSALLTGGMDKKARVWDPQTGKLIITLKGHKGTIRSVAWSPDSSLLLTGSVDNTVRVWDSTTGRQLQKIQGATAGIARVAFNSDGNSFVINTTEGVVTEVSNAHNDDNQIELSVFQ